jgi:hypothetical protein
MQSLSALISHVATPEDRAAEIAEGKESVTSICVKMPDGYRVFPDIKP